MLCGSCIQPKKQLKVQIIGILEEIDSFLELITFEILVPERLRLMGFDNRLIVDCFANVVDILIWQFSTNDKFKSEKYDSISWEIHFQK